jgi:hypothetical protein
LRELFNNGESGIHQLLKGLDVGRLGETSSDRADQDRHAQAIAEPDDFDVVYGHVAGDWACVVRLIHRPIESKG